jgi:hypothetical protein
MMLDYFGMHGYCGRYLPMIEGAASCCLNIDYFFQ